MTPRYNERLQRYAASLQEMSNMAALLSDEELSAVADEYVGRHYGPSFVAVLPRTYTSPPGVLFSADNDGEVLIGDGGFFVSRTGEICQFGSGHVFHEGIDYWLGRFAEGWRPGFYLLNLEPVQNRKKLGPLLYVPGVAFRARLVPGGSLWTWAQMSVRKGFQKHLGTTTAVLLRGETFDDVRAELTRGLLRGCRYAYLGEFRKLHLSEPNFLDQVQPAEPELPTQGGFWVYLPTGLEQLMTDAS